MTDEAFIFDGIIKQICSDKSRFQGLSTVAGPTALWLWVAMGKDLGCMTEKSRSFH